MKVVVLLNAGAGSVERSEATAERIRVAFADAGVDATVWALGADEVKLAARVAKRSRWDAIVAAGGDGTVNALASVLGAHRPLGVLPLGTFNNFAQDLGIPADLEGAVRVIAAGQTRRVDVGDVNGHFFLNNSSIGLYPEFVRERERHHWRRRAGKLVAMLRASRRVLLRLPMLDVLVATADKHVARRTPFVFVGNNRYFARAFSTPRRERLDGGDLHVSVGNGTGRFGVLRLFARAIAGRDAPPAGVETVSLPELWVDAGKRTVEVALDGEVRRLSAPLHYRVRPRFLPVFAPFPAPEAR